MNDSFSAFINLMLIPIVVQVTHVTLLCIIRRNVKFYFKSINAEIKMYIYTYTICINVFVYKNVTVY